MKICIPIMAPSLEESVNRISELENKKYDMLEWRLDCLKGKIKRDSFVETWNAIRNAAGEKPVIVSLRTKAQGGNRELSVSGYNTAMRKLISEIRPAYIDLELAGCGNDANVRMLANMAKKRDIGVIVSYRDLCFTESARDIELLLCRMKYIGADIPMVVYTPNCPQDVDDLIAGAKAARETVGELIAISTGELGARSREGAECENCIKWEIE